MSINFSNIMIALNTQKFSHSEYETIMNACNIKLNEITNDYYKTEMYKLLDDLNDELKNFINSIKKITFYDKFIDRVHSYNIRFKYEYFTITLAYKIGFCSEFGGINIDNCINIIDTHQETCYNLFGDSMISRFIKIINLDPEINHNEIRKMITLMFKAYQPNENMNW